MTTTFSDLARQRFADELAAASVDELRGLAYSYIGLTHVYGDGPGTSWSWKVDMIRDECRRRGRSDLFDVEHSIVERERADTATGPSPISATE